MLKDLFNGKELNKTVNTDEAVAYGAAVQAAILNGEISAEFLDLVLLDMNPLSLITETVGGGLSVIIKRNTPLPTKQTNTYTTVYDNQSVVSFRVYQCGHAMSKNKTSVGKFELTGIPPAPLGVPQIEVTFQIDNNGTLNVRAVENSTGEENEIAVIKRDGRLSKQEIECMMNDAVKYRNEDEKQRQKINVQNALESYCFNMKCAVDDLKLKDKISESDKNTILDKCNEVIRWLDINHLAEKKELEFKQKELECVWNPIMTKIDKCATGCDRTGEKKRGKQSYIMHVRNLALSRGLSHGFEAKHGSFTCFDLYYIIMFIMSHSQNTIFTLPHRSGAQDPSHLSLLRWKYW
jgi:L1 cell adhesion molecule like protein